MSSLMPSQLSRSKDRLLIAAGSFKDVMNPIDMCDHLARALSSVFEVKPELCPISDGGEYFLETLQFHSPDSKRRTLGTLADVEGKEREFGCLEKSGTVYLAASELMKIQKERIPNADPRQLSSAPLGAALKKVSRGFERVVIGLGGTSTADCGLGALFELSDLSAEVRSKSARDFQNPLFSQAEIPKSFDSFQAEVVALCDAKANFENIKTPTRMKVGNLLPDREDIAESLLLKMQSFQQSYCSGGKNSDFYGVAGGVLMGLDLAMDVEAELGIDHLFEELEIGEKISKADWVLSSEGQVDNSDLGKGAFEILRRAKQMGKKTILVCGANNFEGDIGSGKNYVDELVDFSTFDTGVKRSDYSEADVLRYYADHTEKCFSLLGKHLEKLMADSASKVVL